MSDNRLSNLGKDLAKAKQQALLIEVLQSDLNSWIDQSPHVFRVVCDASAAVYDAGVKAGKTNVLVVGEAEGQEPLSIFGSLLGSLDNEFDNLHKRDILRKLTGFGLNQVLGGVVGEAVGESLSVGAGQMMEYLAEWNASAPDFLESAVEVGVESVADESGEIVGDIGGTGADAIAGQFSTEDNIYLSRAARKRLKELAPRLSDKATSHETLQLALEMLLVTAQRAPKVVVVNDPLRLDDASLALLAMLVSLEKDLRQVNHSEEPEQDRAQTAGVSVVLAFTGPQPNDTVENQDIAAKQEAISRLRMMASRYSLLERLDSDIPVPAVRASTFVGRDQELKSLWQHWDSLCEQPSTARKQTWCLIKGEPGTGKTALANRFIHQIRSGKRYSVRFRQSIPTLRMLNQTGHSAQATGLASLKNSIAEELRRLALVYREEVGWFSRSGQQVTEGVQSWKDDAISDDLEAKKRMQRRVGKVISKLMGVDAVVGFASSVSDWSKQQEMRVMREQEFGHSSQANHKEEQFDLLREALREIRKLADKCPVNSESQSTGSARPLLLLIDDLQWVDDFTAEFLLDEWPAEIPVYILATARGSDSFSTTGESSKNQSFNHHRNRLFSELGLINKGLVGARRQNGEEHEGEKKRELLLASRLELKGMDRPMLANLINLTYAGIKKEQAEQFAAGIIKNLSGINDASEVVTLFAIETLNVISDSQFYRRNPMLPRLIEPLPGAVRYRFKKPQSIGLAEALDRVFANLKETYQASYLIESEQGSEQKRFNLASYAVLEERLHLIEQYFGNYGGTARYSLLFSALVGSPFHGGLVQEVLEALRQLSPDQFTGLAPFLKELQAEATYYLTPLQYELLERAYEVIRRLEEEKTEYVHQHSLLQQFLKGQLTKLLLRTAPEAESFETAIAELVGYVKSTGIRWFSRGSKQVPNGSHSKEDLGGLKRSRFLNAVSRYWYEQMECRSSELGEWAESYVESLIETAGNFRTLGRPEDAMPQIEEALSIARRGHKLAPERWDEYLAATLNNAGVILEKLGRSEEALIRYEEALPIWRKGYDADPEEWFGRYAKCLTGIADIYETFGRTGEKRSRLKKAQSVLEEVQSMFEETPSGKREIFVANPRVWAMNYYRSLITLARIHENLGSPEEAELLLKRALSITRVYLDPKEKGLNSIYSLNLTELAQFYERLGRPKEALPLCEEAESIERRAFESAPERYGNTFFFTISYLANLYDKTGYREKASPLYEEALLIARQGYDIRPEVGPEHSAYRLDRLASIHGRLGRPEEALSLYEEALSIRRQGYESARKRWEKSYVRSLNLLASTHQELGRLEKALPLYEEVVSIKREGFESAPELFAADFINELNELADIYEKLGRQQEAHPFYEEILLIGSQDYDGEMKVGSEHHASWLGFSADIYGKLNRLEDAQSALKQELSIRQQGFESDPERWAESYVNCLGNLAINLEKSQDFLGALEYWRKAKQFTYDYSSLPPRTQLECRIMSTLRSADILRTLKRFPEAILELDSSEAMLLEMDSREHPERHVGRVLSLCLRAEVLLQHDGYDGVKVLVPRLQKLINERGLEGVAGSRLNRIRANLENARRAEE